MHTGLAAGWAGCMVLYELIIVDATDPVYNPVWRQGSYVIPFMCRLGVCRSLYSWGLGIKLSINLYWTYETVDIGHITLSGFCVLAGFWHWSYWDLDLFVSSRTGQLVLDLNKILGIHLCLASIACFGFGLGHLCGFYGPGIWTSDSLGVLGSIRLIKPIYSVIGLAPFCYGVISSNHIVAGLFGIFIGLWHMSTRPGKAIYKLLNMGNLEEVLWSSIAAVLFIALLISGAMWQSFNVEQCGMGVYLQQLSFLVHRDINGITVISVLILNVVSKVLVHLQQLQQSRQEIIFIQRVLQFLQHGWVIRDCQID